MLALRSIGTVPSPKRQYQSLSLAIVTHSAAGARLWYLPPYSPDLNPIEQAFAKIKHWMRQAQKRTVEDTWRHIGHLVETIEAAECKNYFENAGYASVKT